jgi:hypothetical protein
VRTVEENRASYCKALSGETLYSALYGSNSTGPSSQQEEGFKGVHRRKRQNSQETAETAKKVANLPTADTDPTEGPTRNLFAPLQTTRMDTNSSSTETIQHETATAAKTGRPPPVILMSTINPIQLQKQLKNVLKEDFKFRTTRNGTRIVTRGMVDFLGVNSHLENHNLAFFTFFPKSKKPTTTTDKHSC